MEQEMIGELMQKRQNVVKLPVIQSFEKPELCGPCGGDCCQNAPGAAMPHDFGADREAMVRNLKEALSTGRWAIDHWSGDPRIESTSIFAVGGKLQEALFIRPAIRGNEDASYFRDNDYRGGCTFHGESGCEIFDRRPSGCRGLEPREDRLCEVRHSGKREAAIAWIPFTNVILEVEALLEEPF